MKRTVKFRNRGVPTPQRNSHSMITRNKLRAARAGAFGHAEYQNFTNGTPNTTTTDFMLSNISGRIQTLLDSHRASGVRATSTPLRDYSPATTLRRRLPFVQQEMNKSVDNASLIGEYGASTRATYQRLQDMSVRDSNSNIAQYTTIGADINDKRQGKSSFINPAAPFGSVPVFDDDHPPPLPPRNKTTKWQTAPQTMNTKWHTAPETQNQPPPLPPKRPGDNKVTIPPVDKTKKPKDSVFGGQGGSMMAGMMMGGMMGGFGMGGGGGGSGGGILGSVLDATNNVLSSGMLADTQSAQMDMMRLQQRDFLNQMQLDRVYQQGPLPNLSTGRVDNPSAPIPVATNPTFIQPGPSAGFAGPPVAPSSHPIPNNI